jgi:hypothetical protein
MENYPAEIRLGTKNLFKIKGPFGLETYILLTTAEPLPDPSILNFSGVAGEEPNDSARRLDDPLTALIKRVGTGTRSQANPAPMTWSIRRLMLQSVPREIDAGKEPVHER